MLRSRLARPGWLAWCLALGCLLASDRARAYCRTSTCDDCPRDDDGCTIGGKAIAWPGRCAALGAHVAASQSADLETVEMLTEQAIATGNAVRCGPKGRPPSIELMATDGPIVCGRSEYVADSANANVLIFRDQAWPYRGDGQELATTSVRARADGEIVDADIEINGTRPLLVDDAESSGGTVVGAHDLLSILTHELGHFLGLDHSSDPESIMQIMLPPRVVRTSLGDDDIAAICAASPPEREAAECDPAPRGAFSAQCALDPSTGGACSVARVRSAAPRGAARGPWALLLVVALL